MTLVIKTEGDPSALTTSVREVIREMDPNLPVADVRTMEDVVGTALATPRFTSVLLSIFAALALTLSAIGIYACCPTWWPAYPRSDSGRVWPRRPTSS